MIFSILNITQRFKHTHIFWFFLFVRVHWVYLFWLLQFVVMVMIIFSLIAFFNVKFSLFFYFCLNWDDGQPSKFHSQLQSPSWSSHFTSEERAFSTWQTKKIHVSAAAWSRVCSSRPSALFHWLSCHSLHASLTKKAYLWCLDTRILLHLFKWKRCERV